MDTVNKTLNKAILQSLTGKYSLYLFQLLSLAILSRIFSPAEFGVIAAAQVFAMFFQMLASSGLAPAIVYQTEVTAKMRDGVFSFSLIVGLLFAAIFYFCAELLFNWFNFDAGLVVFYTLVPCVLFSALSMMPMASLLKDTQFIMIAKAEIIAEFIAFTGCVIASFYWSGISALALKFLLVPILRFLLYYLFSTKTEIGRAKFGTDIGQVSKLYGYAKYQVAFNILNFFSRNIDSLLIAKYFGANMLGVYDKTYQVMRYPLQLFTFAITPALQPVFTKHKHEPHIVFKTFMDVANKLALLGLFSATVMYWNAKDIIYVLFGDQWFDVVPFLQILALSIPIQMVLSSTGGVYQAFGATKPMFLCGVFSAVLNVSAIILGVYSESLLNLCAFLVLSFSINYIQCFFVLSRTVFSGQSIAKQFRLGFLICITFINLAFSPNSTMLSPSFLDSIFAIFFTSVVTIIPIVLFYFTKNKFDF